MDISELLKVKGFRYNKQFGQNFITDKNLLDAIAEDAGVTPDTTVIEVGMGAGTLTQALATKAKKVIGFEIDNNLKPILAETLQEFNNVQMIFEDVMRHSGESLDALAGGSFAVVANLPYYITTPVIMKFFEECTLCTSITVMVQKEVADRLCAEEGTKDYGAITASLLTKGIITQCRQVSRKLFFPMPNVDSTVVRIDINPNKHTGVCAETYAVIRCAFTMRRKTLANNLINFYSMTRPEAEAVLTSASIPLTARGETLNVPQFISLSRAVKEYKEGKQ